MTRMTKDQSLTWERRARARMSWKIVMSSLLHPQRVLAVLLSIPATLLIDIEKWVIVGSGLTIVLRQVQTGARG